MTKILAHRGNSEVAPENTMAAFKSAVDAGADGVELDVQLSKDGVPVIFHDEKLNRITGAKGYLKNYTYKQLRELDCGAWFSDKFIDSKISSLEETLDFFKNTEGIYLNIELKNGMVKYPNIEEKVIKLIKSFELMDRTIVSTFNQKSLIKVKEVEPEIKTGLLYRAKIYKSWEYAKELINADAIHPNYFSISENEVKQAHKNNIKVNVYTVDKEKDIKRFINWGVDILITNCVQKAKRIRTEIVNY
ncbi:glycerophosphodiester phosphodiesterase [Proteinivorax tanatarense]|uniref:Glycerophosphodiester phosphodiesterase n=1 Tax=Proteinivorax tanatarense TaxID=1260629 RepID=A0AAU7VJK1_9FIRM